LMLVFSDVIHVLPSAGNQSSSWLHAGHRAVLAKLGMAGQKSQPREIYLSPSFVSNSLENGGGSGASVVESAATCPEDSAGNSPSALGALVDTVALDSSAARWSGWWGEDDPRKMLADWCFVDDPKHRYATKIVNQVWREVFGVPIAPNPNDIGARFPPIAPGLLDGLARDFRKHDYSLRWLLKELLCSATYRQQTRKSEETDGNATITDYTPRPLRGEERFELIRSIAGNDFGLSDHVAPAGGSAYSAFVELRPRKPADHLLLSMRRGAMDSAGDLPTAAIHDGLFNENLLDWFRLPGGRLQEMVNLDALPEATFADLYRRVTGQQPTAEQVEYAAMHVRTSADVESAWTEILWALLNSETSFFNY